MQNQESKFYYAFVSYNHKDKRDAKRLHRGIEAYRIPKAIRKGASPELPKEIKPLYLDSDESESGRHLSEVMRNYLNNSNSLIVVCSPNSAKSGYVDFEVETFKNEYKDRKIIPYIIAGSPSINPKKNCYPPSLDIKITGSSIKELGRQKALVKVVAAIFDIDFDSLWDRHKRRERQRKLYWTIAITVIVGLFIGMLINRNIKITQQRNEALTANAYVNYKEGAQLINSGKPNTGIAYLTRSLENIRFEPSIRKLNSVLLQGSFLILDTVMANTPARSDLDELNAYVNESRYNSPSGAYCLCWKNGKLTIERVKDAHIFGNLDLYYHGKIIPQIRFSHDEKTVLLMEAIYDDVDQDDYSEYLTETNQFRLRVCNVDPFYIIKDIQINGSLDDAALSPMGNHIVISYQKEKEFETTIEAIPLGQPYKKWECNVLGYPQKLLYNPNGIYLSAVFSRSVNDPDEIKIYNIFNSDHKSFNIELPDKVKRYCYSNDGRRMAVFTGNNELYIYDIPQCNLAFAPVLLADSLNVISLEFDLSDTKINVKTRKNIYSYLLQKTPFKLGISKSNLPDKICYNSTKNIIATSHPVNGDKGYILFEGINANPLKYEHKINTLLFSPQGNYLVVGTGDLLDKSGSGDIYLYRLEQSGNTLNHADLLLKEVYQSRLDFPVSKIVFSQDEKRFIAHTAVFGEKAKEVYSFSIGEGKNVTEKNISCKGNVEVVRFINNDNLAIGTDVREVELWNITTNKREWEVRTTHFPVAIEKDDNQGIVVASTFNHSSGEIRYINSNGISGWDSPLTTKFGIQKLIVVDNKAIIISEENIISIIDLKTKERIVNDIKVQGTIKNAVVTDKSLKVLSYYFDHTQAFNLNEAKQFSGNQGRQSFIQTFDVETGEELEVPIIINDDIINIEACKDKLLYYSSDFLFSVPLISKNFDPGLNARDFIKIADAIAECRINSLGVIETTDSSLVDLRINSILKQWFCSPFEERSLFPGDSTLIKDQISLLCDQGTDDVIQALDIYPSYLKAQNEYWFGEAKKIALDNFISGKRAPNISQHTNALINWETYFSNYKTEAIYNDPQAKLFADFYTKLMVRQHPNDISVLKERANFCQHINRIDEYNSYMDKIEEVLLNDL